MDVAPWAERVGKADRLAALERQVVRDLAAISHPVQPWLTPRLAPDGTEALDVLIVGAGQSGVAVAFALSRAQVTNVLLVDRAPEAEEGPWRTYARMPTLRSPKTFTGPDLDLPNLTYQAWHEARWGTDHWEALELIERVAWADYLLWVRKMVGARVENRTALTDIAPAGELLAATVDGPSGARTIHARKIVLATGQESTGRWAMPAMVEALPDGMRAHTADPIDFAALAGRTVFVLGAGASAFDNAATALEAGADVTLFCRRPQLQVIQPYRWLTFAGSMRHLGDLDDAWRWRFMRHILGLREGFPQATFDRCAAHANFTLRTDCPWQDARVADGRVIVTTAMGAMAADFVIAGTGIDNDFSLRPELARCAGSIATWGDRYTPPPEEADARLSRFPYLSPDYAFEEKTAGAAPWIKNIHLFSIASTMSFGPSGSSINAMTTAAPKVAEGLTRGLFKADVAAHWEALQAYDVPQAIVPPGAIATD